MYVIVVGAGAIGSQVIELLEQTQTEIVVIERNRGVAETISQEHDCLVLNADATEKDTLLDAGAEKADAVISTTDEDATNIMVMLLSEELEIESKVSVVQNPDHMDIFRRIGVNVLENPQRLIAEYLVRAVQRPSVEDFMTLSGGAEIFEVTVTEDAPIAGKTLREADEAGILEEGILVVAVERGDDVIMPRGNTKIDAGDEVTVFSEEGVSADVVHLFSDER